MAEGVATGFALNLLQERGILFVTPGQRVRRQLPPAHSAGRPRANACANARAQRRHSHVLALHRRGGRVQVYSGMIIGENSRDEDMEVNPCKEKHLSNVRNKGSEEQACRTRSALTPTRLHRTDPLA
jgi:predicted membrane GTPase involved in stress response